MGIYKGVIVWKGDTGFPLANEVFSLVPWPHEWGSGKGLYDFILFMVNHTKCNCARKAQYYEVSHSPSAPSTGANVDVRAYIYFRDPTTLRVECFTYPCPEDADVEVTSTGKRIKDSVVALIVAKIAYITGVDYIPLRGDYLERA